MEPKQVITQGVAQKVCGQARLVAPGARASIHLKAGFQTCQAQRPVQSFTRSLFEALGDIA